MAKRGVVQLQTELETDEEFDQFLDQPGLLVIDVYTEWCGPCTGMLSTLRKVKLSPLGDSLNLAIARSDTISYLRRFHKKSEPTWLFIKGGKSINIFFGSDCPKFLDLIGEELMLVNRPIVREYYDIAQMLPKEVELDNIKNAAKRAQIQKEIEEKEVQRLAHLNFVTDTIRENIPDMAVTIIGPQANRDTVRHLMDYGIERFNIQCKDRRFQPITKEQFETINYDCKDPLPDDVINALDGKDVFVCLWKDNAETKRPLLEILENFAEEIVKPIKVQGDEHQTEEEFLPPIITPMRVEIQYELPLDEECPPIPEEVIPKPQKELATDEGAPQPVDGATEQEEAAMEIGEEEGEGPMIEPAMSDVDLNEVGLGSMYASETVEEEEEVTETPKQNICTRIVIIPPMWIPKDWRTNSAIIYTLFRAQTTEFLPPDPLPDPPHIIMAFDTYKKKDLVDFAERYKEDIPLYGFFTSDEAEEAELIASGKHSYAHKTHSSTDKLVFKVNKRTSHTMLSLVTYGPTYVSPNTTIGAEEAKIFFPDDFVSAEEENRLEEKKKKSTSKKSGKQEEEPEKDDFIDVPPAEVIATESTEQDGNDHVEEVKTKDIATEKETVQPTAESVLPVEQNEKAAEIVGGDVKVENVENVQNVERTENVETTEKVETTVQPTEPENIVEGDKIHPQEEEDGNKASTTVAEGESPATAAETETPA